jgi:hypothetical protein
VTPLERHEGRDIALLAQRKALYEAAKAQRPERWSGATRNWEPMGEVWLNPVDVSASLQTPPLGGTFQLTILFRNSWTRPRALSRSGNDSLSRVT